MDVLSDLTRICLPFKNSAKKCFRASSTAHSSLFCWGSDCPLTALCCQTAPQPIRDASVWTISLREGIMPRATPLVWYDLLLHDFKLRRPRSVTLINLFLCQLAFSWRLFNKLWKEAQWYESSCCCQHAHEPEDNPEQKSGLSSKPLKEEQYIVHPLCWWQIFHL